jgi:UPF0755 protein
VSSGPPPVPGGRSPEEREAARRRRAAQRAGQTPPAAEELPPPPAPASADWMSEAERLTGTHTVADLEAELGGEPRRGRRRRRKADALAAPAGEPRRRRLKADPLAAPRGDRFATGGRGPRWGRIVATGVLAVVLLAIGWFCVSLFQPFGGDGEGEVRVTIPAGSSLGDIADLLEREGVVSSASFFQLRARLAGRSDQLKPGTYQLKREMSFVAALDALEQGVPPDVVQITVPEGRSRREIAASVKGELKGSYLGASRRSPLLSPRRYGAPAGASLEGFLFPATYELKRDKGAQALVDEQLRTFKRQFGGVNLRYARSKNLTPYDVLIIASMVEREAQLARERPIVASVIYNRLSQGMTLGIDATIRYALNQWTEPLRQSELADPTPYNTRLNPGLPPGPIGNPGIASIKAAARPARSDYLFYVVKPCGEGQHAFSSTDAEFQRDVESYNAERAKRGGNSPASCD